MTHFIDPHLPISAFAETEGMDRWLDHLETLSIAIGQRRMTVDQVDRFGRLLQGMEDDALCRARQARKAA